MPTQYITTNSIGAGNRISGVSGDRYVILSGVTVGSTDIAAFSSSFSHQIDVEGAVFGSGTGILQGADNDAGALFVGVNGVISGASTGYFSVAGNVSIINNGRIEGFNGQGISAFGNDSFFLANYGTITGAGATVLGGGDGVTLGGIDAGAVVMNYGVIGAADAAFNSGSNSYSGASVGADRVYNFGVMYGSINLSGGNDLYDGAQGRLVTGSLGGVFGGTGNDTIYGGIGADRLFGESNDDTLYFSIEDAVVNGGSGSDTARNLYNDFGLTFDMGGNSIEFYYGSQAGETILTSANIRMDVDAGGGNDLILGGTQGDGLAGGNGDDTIFGGDGPDVMAGGFGNDSLTSGNGDDVLSGEGGRDLFCFRGVGGGNDQITDFSIGEDRIEILRSGFLNPTQWAAGGLDPARFVASANPTPNLSTACFLFDNAGPGAGQLYWNDGNGGATGIAIITLAPGQNITFFSAADFVLV
jgi:Ca2+-binding RTX toxin-like protein